MFWCLILGILSLLADLAIISAFSLNFQEFWILQMTSPRFFFNCPTSDNQFLKWCFPKSMRGMDLGPLHRCSNCAAGSSSGSRSCLWLCCLPRSLSPNWAACLASIEDVPSLTATWYAKTGWYSWETSPLLRRRGKEVVVGKGRCEGESGRRGRRGTVIKR